MRPAFRMQLSIRIYSSGFGLLITEEAFLVIEGEVQNSENVVLIKTREIKPLAHDELVGSESHDFR